LEGQVRRLPAVNDVPSLLAASDALVLASRFEGLPLVALEAMALGRPVVGTRVCGLEETVEDGVTGRLVAAEDAAALAAAMLDILERPAEGARFGFLGRRRYEARFRAQRMVAETDAVYDSLLGGAGAPQEMDQPFDGSVPPPLVTAR
jgi:glycosyltransferase involved in cell wall biosynthesis